MIGHRGAAAVAPENTLAALEVAVAAGVDLVEFDISPGLLLGHSELELPPTRSTSTRRSSYLRGHELGVHLDVKLPGYEADVVEAVRRHGLVEPGHLRDRVRRQLATARAARAGGPARDRLPARPARRLAVSMAARARRRRAPPRFVKRCRCGSRCSCAPPTRTSSRSTTRSARAPQSQRHTGAARRSSPGRPTTRRSCSRLAGLGVDAIVSDDPGDGPGYTACAVKRLLAIGLFASGFVVAGVFSGAVIADVTTSLTTSTAPATTTGVTTATTTAVTTSTTTAVTTSTTPAKVTTPSVSATIPKGVRVAGVLVGGLKPAAAVAAVQHAFRKPLAVVVNRSRLELDPTTVAAAYSATAVARARIAAPRTNVSLAVAVRGAPVRAWVAKIAQRFTSAPVDATLTFPNAHPAIRGDRRRPPARCEAADRAHRLDAAFQLATAGARAHTRDRRRR